MISGAAAAALVELDPAPDGRPPRPRCSPRSPRRAGARPGRSWRACWPSGRPRRACSAFALCGHRRGLRGRGAGRSRSPRRPPPARWRIQRPERAARRSACLFARVARHRRARAVGGDGAVPVRRPLVRRASCWTRRTSRCWARSAGCRWPRPASPSSSSRIAAGRAPRPRARAARRGPGRARGGVPAALAAGPAARRGLLAGAGHGVGFLGAQAQLNAAAPPLRRGEVNAAFYTLHLPRRGAAASSAPACSRCARRWRPP